LVQTLGGKWSRVKVSILRTTMDSPRACETKVGSDKRSDRLKQASVTD
jgi:hypothetical protein